MKFYNIITGALQSEAQHQQKSGPNKLSQVPRGCAQCPLASVRGINKVKGLVRVTGKLLMLWAQSPGATENEKRLELVGKVGQFLWKVLKPLGIDRTTADIQNVLRCRPANKYGREHQPTELELHCCSIYNDKAIEKNDQKAVVHYVLGKVAAEQLLGKRHSKVNPIQWNDRFSAYVVLSDHPSYVVRSGGVKAGGIYTDFCMRARAVRSILDNPGRWGYVLSRGYKTYTLPKSVRRELRKLEREDVVSVDIEVGKVDGVSKVLQISFSCGNYKDRHDWTSWQGRAFAVVLHHPENKAKPSSIKAVEKAVVKFLERQTPEKVMQFGSYDLHELENLLGCRIAGYHEDSQYAAYLGEPTLQAYGLNNMAQRRFPEFGDYKLMTEGLTNFANTPLKTLAVYGSADADLTLRMYRFYASDRTKALLRTYTKAAITLSQMERRGPYLDKTALAKIDEIIPRQISELKERLKSLALREDFNPNTPAHIAALLYDKLKLPEIAGRSTGKQVLQTLIAKGRNVEVIRSVLQYRYLAKAKTTYIDGYRRSAEAHGGQLRTKWNLTGTVSGRMSSGSGKASKDGTLINFQNFHGNPLLKNLLVSDINWRAYLTEIDLDSFVYLSLDYSQIEIRMLAVVTEDELLIKQFNSGEDIHCQVGHTLTGWDIKKIASDKETRRLVKNIHFAIVYGVGKSGLYGYLVAKGVTGINQKRVEELYDAYFAMYRGVARWIRKQRSNVEKFGWAENLFGFRRPIGTWDTSRTTYWANQAVNTPIQGAAHTLLLTALALLQDYNPRHKYLRRPVLEIHDDVVFRLKLRNLPTAFLQGKRLLETDVPQAVEADYGITLPVPLVAEGAAGYCLGSICDYNGEQQQKFLAAWRKKHKEVEKAGWEKLLPDSE